MRVRAILNPRAGLASRRALSALQPQREGWARLEITETERRGHARELSEQAVRDGCQVVLAVGGDGTTNEVAQGLLGSNTALGIVPVGSGNGLARTLGLPLDPELALRALAAAVVRRMDVGFINDRPFLNVAGAGFDAEIGAAFHARGLTGQKRGIWPYVRLSLARVRSYTPEDWRLMADTTQIEGQALLVAFLNGRQYGAGAVIAPRARLDDGRLDLVWLDPGSWLELLWNTRHAFWGSIEKFRRYKTLTAERMTLEARGPFLHHRDGEPEPETGRADVRVERRALHVLVPRAVADDPLGPFLPPGD